MYRAGRVNFFIPVFLCTPITPAPFPYCLLGECNVIVYCSFVVLV